jgi:hypothetical protein
MRIKTERRKQIREALQQERVWWASPQFLDCEMRRRLTEKDRVSDAFSYPFSPATKEL